MALLAVPALAQDPNAPERLEDLIPDSAIENPEAWAAEGVEPDPSLDDVEALAVEDVDADNELADLPEVDLPWPDGDIVQDFADLEPEEDIEFAEVEEDFDPLLALPDGYEINLGRDLTLVLPSERSLFPETDEFVDRFKALSQVEEFDDEDGNIAVLAARARADEELLDRLLRIYGYYDNQIIREIGAEDETGLAAEIPPPEGAVRFAIIPGRQYSLGAIELGSLEADTAPFGDAAAARAAFGMDVGDPLLSDSIVEERYDLDRWLGENGYPFASIDEPELLVDHARQQGDLTMIVQPQDKYRFGGVNSSLPDFLSGEHFASIARFDPGDIYNRSDELDLRRAILATGLVSSVTITPREVAPAVGGEPGTVDLDVDITQAPLRTLAGSIGYGSGEGFKLEASWEHRNLFPPEGMLRLRGIAGTREQLAGVTFRKNNFGNRDRILTLDAYATTIDTEAYDGRTVAVRGTYEKVSNLLFQKELSWAVGAEILATDERNRVIDDIPRPRETYFVGAVFGRATIDKSDSLLDPTEGFRLTGFLSPEVSRAFDTTTFYLRAQADGSIYRQVNDRIVLAGRTRVATIQGADTFEVAPSRRLYAGGGSSVRGYGYQAVGPLNDLGEPTGGRSLVELAGEARIKTGFLDGALSVVPFLDVGSVSADPTPDFKYIKYGAGLGVRYATGFGPIRLDVGVPLNPGPYDDSFAVYVSLGQAF